MTLLDAWPVHWRTGRSVSGDGVCLSRFELGTRAGLVGCECLFKPLTLPGVHRLGAGGQLLRAQASQRQGDALKPGVFELDDAVTSGKLLALRAMVNKH